MNKIENAKMTLASALEIAKNNDTFLKPTSKKNKKHNSGYLAFLSKLIPEILSTDSREENKILHLGESHCLTFTNQTVELKGEKCTIKPSVVKGAKAFHLNDKPRPNPHRTGVEIRLQRNLDNYKRIFILWRN